MPSAPALAAHAGLLDAAERRGRVGDQALVEADHAHLQPLDDAQRAVEVPGEDVADQAVLGVVGRRSASSSVRNGEIGATGPKISSRCMPASVGTPVSTVGVKK